MTSADAPLIERRLMPVVRQRLGTFPVIVLTGPRTVGKSTLLRAIAAQTGSPIVDLDDVGVRAAVAQDPALYASGSRPVVIDEFQKEPVLLDAIKAELNRSTRPGQYLLAGSTRYDALPVAAQALTGRAHILPVWPLSQAELSEAELSETQFSVKQWQGAGRGALDVLLHRPHELVSAGPAAVGRDSYVDAALRGGLPLAARLDETTRRLWLRDYVDLVCERDVLELSRVRQRAVLPRLLTRLAGQTAGLLNMADAARGAGVSTTVAENYTRLLEAVFLIRRLPAWGTTMSSRVNATAKLHVVDSALAAYLLNLTRDKLDRRVPSALSDFGRLVETFVVGELITQASWRDDPVRIGHWRTRDGAEVDCVLERSDGGVVGVEVKASSRVEGADARGLRGLADRLPDTWVGGVVFHLGTQAFTLDRSRSLYAVPVSGLPLCADMPDPIRRSPIPCP
ncbi:MAG: ATP-binding protein [Pseudonocardiaceae bacterium]